jgi:GTP-binding protein HflX
LILLDASDPSAMSQLDTVEKTLKDIGAEHQPRLLVLNKIDRLIDPADRLVWVSRCPDAIQISSVTSEGVEILAEEVRQAVIGPVREVLISLPIQASKAIDFLEKRTEIVERAWEDNRALYTVRLGRNQIEQILSRERDVTIDAMPAVDAIESLWIAPPKNGDCCHLPPHRLER